MTEDEDRELVEDLVEHFEQNDIAEFIMEVTHGTLSEEPRTLSGTFPGNRTRAMGHALAVVEDAEEHGLEAEREYVEPVEGRNSHHIKIHLNGGDES